MFGEQQRTLSAIALVYLSYFASSVFGHEEVLHDEIRRELNPHWGIIFRNVFGSPSITLQDGPFVYAANGNVSSPPFGNGGLAFLVGVPTQSSAEKAEFGNEVDYYGKLLRDVNQVGFHLFTTQEDKDRNADNLPNIRFELYFNLGGVLTYTSLVWSVPGNAIVVNEWTRYIDATREGKWYFSQDAKIMTGCTLSSGCTFYEMIRRASLKDPAAYIISFAVGKGRDYEWQGAIDGLRFNDQIIDFEFDGVYEISRQEHRDEDRHEHRAQYKRERRDEGRHDHRDGDRHDHRDQDRHDHRDGDRYDHRDEDRHDYRDEDRHDYRDGDRHDHRDEDRHDDH